MTEPKLISVTEATTAMQWLEEFMQGDSPDAAQARVVCGLIRGLEAVVHMEQKYSITLTEDEQELLKFLRDFDAPTDNELGPALETFENRPGFLPYSPERVNQMLYLLSRAGLVSLDTNASRSRYWVKP